MTYNDEDDYDVGYKNPPMHSRFQKGKSGNPNGRPKKKSVSLYEVLEKEFHRKINVNEGGKKSQIEILNAIIRQLMHKAVLGDRVAIKLAMEWMDKHDQKEPMFNLPIINMYARDGSFERSTAPDGKERK